MIRPWMTVGLLLFVVGCGTPHRNLGPEKQGSTLEQALLSYPDGWHQRIQLEPITGTELAWVGSDTTVRNLPPDFALPWAEVMAVVGKRPRPGSVHITVAELDGDPGPELLYQAGRAGGPPPAPGLPPQKGYDLLVAVDVSGSSMDVVLAEERVLDDAPESRYPAHAELLGGADMDGDGKREFLVERTIEIEELGLFRKELQVFRWEDTPEVLATLDLGEESAEEVELRRVVAISEASRPEPPGWGLVLAHYSGQKSGLLEMVLEVWRLTPDGLSMQDESRFAVVERAQSREDAVARAKAVGERVDTPAFVVSDLEGSRFAVVLGPAEPGSLEQWREHVQQAMGGVETITGQGIGRWVRP